MRMRSSVAEIQLGRWAHAFDSRDAPVAGSNDQAIAQRRHAVGIAEEVDDPGRDEGRHPAGRRPDPEQQQRGDKTDGDELVPVTVDRGQAIGDRVQQRMPIGQSASSERAIAPCQTNACGRRGRVLPAISADHATAATGRPHVDLERNGHETRVALRVLDKKQDALAARLFDLVDGLLDIVVGRSTASCWASVMTSPAWMFFEAAGLLGSISTSTPFSLASKPKRVRSSSVSGAAINPRHGGATGFCLFLLFLGSC